LLKRVHSENVGSAKIVIVKDDDEYVGTLWKDGKQTETLSGDDLDRLKAQLQNIAGRLHPDYYGIDSAKERFLSFFPGGFEDPNYVARERDYKLKARQALLAAAPLDLAAEADENVSAACRKGLVTNLLSPFEAARFNEVLTSADGPAYLRAAASFTREQSQRTLDAMVKAITPHGAATWPLLTYVPYLWRPETHMFLKPEATTDFATRVGHEFAREYDSDRRLSVYESLLQLAAWTEQRIADLQPADRIDVQSFIWVVGSYTEADRNAV
jgi:hypothetical protein